MGARRAVRAGIGLLLATVTVVALPLGASAHALRLSSSPDADALLTVAPAQVSITFGEQPDPRLSTVAVLDTAGRDHAAGPAAAAPDDSRTLVTPVGKLADGVYTVAWRTLSTVDGHRAAGSFAFGVGVDQSQLASLGGGSGGGATDSSPPPSVVAVVGRWLLYVGLLAVLGSALVGTVVLAGGAGPPILAQALGGAVVAAVGTVLVIVGQAQDAGLGPGGLVSSSIGRSVVERLLAALATLGLAAAAPAVRGRVRTALLLLAAAAAALGMLVDVAGSHAAATSSWTWANVLLQWAHIAAAGFWIGGLAALLLALRGDPDEDRARAARRFSTGAGLALLVVLATGTVRAVVQIGAWGDVLGTWFGRIVVIKAGLIGVLALLGAANRWRHVPSASRALRGLRRVGSVELGVAAAAVLAAALLVNVAPPVQAQSAAGPPAPQPLTLSAADFATTVKVDLSVSPGTPGFNTFTARVRGYDSGADLPVNGVELDFTPTQRPEVGGSTLALARAADGSWTARAANLSIDGVWSVTALVENGAHSVDVHFTLPTRSTRKVDVSAVPGQPTIYTVHLADGRKVQWYLDPQTPGKDEIHATFFDAAGNGYPAAHGALSALPENGTMFTLPTRELEPGHYVGDVTVGPGAWRFDVIATGTDGAPVGVHVDITVGS